MTRDWDEVKAELFAGREREIAEAAAFLRGRQAGYAERLLEELDPDPEEAP